MMEIIELELLRSRVGARVGELELATECRARQNYGQVVTDVAPSKS